MRSTLIAAAAALTLMVAPGAHATVFGDNLLDNGGAEANNFTGWVTTSNISLVPYGIGGGFPTASNAGPENRGNIFFAGGSDTAQSSATQTVDLSALSAAINTGAARYDLSAWLGGYANQDDNARVSATFYGSGGVALANTSLGPVLAADRDYQTGLLWRDVQGYIPVGTLNVGITLSMTRVAGSYNDGYADNLSFAVAAAPVPEADNYAMLLGGLAVLGLVAHRRQRALRG